MFTRLHLLTQGRYHISVFGQFVNNYFTMELLDGEWQFSKPHIIKGWIKEVESELQDALEKNYKE